MENDDIFIVNLVNVANTVELVRQTLSKVGLEFIAPLPEARELEVISKNINAAIKQEITE